MSASGGNIFSISLKRSGRSLDRARKRLVRFLTDNDVTGDMQARMDLSVYEIVANIIEHAGKAFIDERITVNGTVDRSAVIITVRYRGLEFDPTRAPLPDLKAHIASGKNGGLGIYITRKLVDRIEYSHEKGLNTITLANSRTGATES